MDDAKKPDEQVNTYVEQLIKALEDGEMPAKKTSGAFLSSPVWFVATVIALCINFLLVAAIFWQRLKIDYLVTKIIGE